MGGVGGDLLQGILWISTWQLQKVFSSNGQQSIKQTVLSRALSGPV